MDTVVDGLPLAKLILFSSFYAISILTIGFGISGLIGTIKKNRCLLCLYSIAILFLFLLALAVGIAGLIFFP